MATHTITFSKLLEANTIKTVVVEVFLVSFYFRVNGWPYTLRHVQNCREIIYGSDNDSERRRTAEYISLVFPKFSLEYGFAQGPDPYWIQGVDETDAAAELRAQKVLDKIFQSEPREKICKYRQFSTRRLGDGWCPILSCFNHSALRNQRFDHLCPWCRSRTLPQVQCR